MRSGVRLGIDVGKARVGIAASDPDGLLATPVQTVQRGDLDENVVRGLVTDLAAIEVIVGLPVSLSGRDTRSTQDARDVAAWLASFAGVPVRLVDERMSTVTAQRSLQRTGRNSKSARPVVDQAAAMIILQHALDIERSGGSPPGTVVDPDERP